MVQLAEKQGPTQQELVKVASEQKTMSRNLELVEAFIVAAYASEFAAAAHVVEAGHVGIAGTLIGLVIVVAWIAYHVLDLDKHREGGQARSFWNRKSMPLVARFLLPIVLASLIIAFARSPHTAERPTGRPSLRASLDACLATGSVTRSFPSAPPRASFDRVATRAAITLRQASGLGGPSLRVRDGDRNGLPVRRGARADRVAGRHRDSTGTGARGGSSRRPGRSEWGD